MSRKKKEEKEEERRKDEKEDERGRRKKKKKKRRRRMSLVCVLSEVSLPALVCFSIRYCKPQERRGRRQD